MECIKCKTELPEDAIYCHKCGKKQTITKRKRRKGYGGGGTVFKNAGNREKPWVARGPATKIDGRVVRPFVGSFATEAEAKEAVLAHKKTSITDKYNYTVEEVREAWKEAHYPTLKSYKGKEGYDGAWKHIPDEIRKRKMRDIRTEDLQIPINTLVAAGKSQSLCEKVRQLESQLCQWAMDNDILDRNYALKTKIPIIENQKGKREFTEQEVALIYSCRDDPEYWEIARIVLCWIYTGTRTNELLLINSKDVHLWQNYMIGGLKTETGKNRIIPIHPAIRPFIEIWYDLGADCLIPNGNGVPYLPNFIRKKFYRFMEHLNILDVEPRTARRSCATALSRAGVRPELISRLLGHTDYDTTEIYIMNNLQDLLEANAAIPAPLATDG